MCRGAPVQLYVHMTNLRLEQTIGLFQCRGIESDEDGCKMCWQKEVGPDSKTEDLARAKGLQGVAQPHQEHHFGKRRTPQTVGSCVYCTRGLFLAIASPSRLHRQPFTRRIPRWLVS